MPRTSTPGTSARERGHEIGAVHVAGRLAGDEQHASRPRVRPLRLRHQPGTTSGTRLAAIRSASSSARRPSRPPTIGAVARRDRGDERGDLVAQRIAFAGVVLLDDDLRKLAR